MARAKRTKKTAPRRESPVQFRPGAELGQLLDDFTATHDVSRNEACRHLIALALVGLDARHYAVVREMAAGAMAGAFVRACLHVHAALLAAARLEGEPLVEPRRAKFVVDTARAALAVKGRSLTADCSAFLPHEAPEAPPVAPRHDGPSKRRIVSKPVARIADPPGTEGASGTGGLPPVAKEELAAARVDG